MHLCDVRLIQLPKIPDERGNLSFLENENQIPFSIQRAHWIYDVPAGQTKEGYAYKTQQEFIIALSGSFTILVADGTEEKRYLLNKPNIGLFVPAMIWHQLEDFATNSLAIVVGNGPSNSTDSIGDYDTFKQLQHGQ